MNLSDLFHREQTRRSKPYKRPRTHLVHVLERSVRGGSWRCIKKNCPTTAADLHGHNVIAQTARFMAVEA